MKQMDEETLVVELRSRISILFVSKVSDICVLSLNSFLFHFPNSPFTGVPFIVKIVFSSSRALKLRIRELAGNGPVNVV